MKSIVWLIISYSDNYRIVFLLIKWFMGYKVYISYKFKVFCISFYKMLYFN